MLLLDVGLSMLKPDLIEHHDYEAVSQEMWKYFSSWYAYDISIPRYLAYDIKTEKTFLELYPKFHLWFALINT